MYINLHKNIKLKNKITKYFWIIEADLLETKARENTY